MNTLEILTAICINFKEGKYNLEEFQNRLDSLMVSDELKPYLDKVRFDAVNRIEEIRFCSLKSNFHKYGVEVSDNLLEKVNSLKL